MFSQSMFFDDEFDKTEVFKFVYGSGSDGTDFGSSDPITDFMTITEVDRVGINGKIAVGVGCTLVIKTDGTLWGTGRNIEGQLGLGDNTDRNVFTQVGTDTNWDNVFCYKSSTLVIKTDGTLWGTGRNIEGQLGLGDNTDRNVFTQVGTDTNWSFGATSSHSLFVKTDGTLWGTGRNIEGQLGLGDNTDRNVFTQSDIDVSNEISCGDNHSAYTKTWGGLYLTGRNIEGQLGLGDNTDRNVFTRYGGQNGWDDVACGANHTIARQGILTVTTGLGSSGQLGNNNTNSINVFTGFFGVLDVVGVDAGGDSTMMLLGDNRIASVGDNTNKQLSTFSNPVMSYSWVYDPDAHQITNAIHMKVTSTHSVIIQDSI